MFNYFGYGSNINLISLRAKGVAPIHSEKGWLPGWKLRFNVQHWFRHEGGMGNIEPTGDPADIVEGVLHTCEDDHLQSLDAMEAYGIGYDRIEVTVQTNHGPVQALAYVGLADFINDQCEPSRRYINIILKGAEAAGLSEEYIQKLRDTPLMTPANYPVYQYPDDQGVTYNSETLATNPYLTALGEGVFDMRGSRKQLECLISLFGGKDMTLFHVKRIDNSDGTETWEDVAAGRISEEARSYLNAYLHEYSREFRYAGRFIR